MNKKGMFFTILVISLISLFILTYNIYSSSQENKREAVKRRITTLNNFIFSLEQDLSRKIYISSFRAIFLIEKKIVDTGEYIDNLNSTFNELIFNGSIDGEQEIIMQGSTISDIQNSIREKAGKINANFSFSYPKLILTQTDPWHIKVILDTNISIRDNTGLAFWNRAEGIVTFISINNFEDPVYVVSTNGLVINQINQTPYKEFVSGTDYSNLTSHVQNSYYLASIHAPSFLKRLQGDLNPDENGIESLVYLPELSQQGIPVEEKSIVDYVYFSSNNPDSCQIDGMSSWFRLDTVSPGHLNTYNSTCV
jgi:hypothetical protein